MSHKLLYVPYYQLHEVCLVVIRNIGRWESLYFENFQPLHKLSRIFGIQSDKDITKYIHIYSWRDAGYAKDDRTHNFFAFEENSVGHVDVISRLFDKS